MGEEESAEADAPETERKKRHEVHAARLAELQVQLDKLEDDSLNLFAKLEARKIDLLMLGSTPRGVYVRDETKKILADYIEARRSMRLAARELRKLLEI